MSLTGPGAAVASTIAGAARMPARAPVTAAPTRARFEALPPLALYVHLPWCLRKCPYCDFNSHARPDSMPEGPYVEALIADLDAALPAVQGREVRSVFIGGGTPSLFGARSIDRLLSAVRGRVRLAPEAEVTMEANPGTFEAERFGGYRAAGVTRLSIGVQSFDDARLAAIGRVHGSAEAHRAVEAALALFPAVNVDLMYALPGQDVAGALRDARAAIAHGVEHVSAYHLTLEPNTLFHRHPPPLPDEDAAASMQEAVDEALRAAGLARYEVSAYARPGRECRHNVNYWRFGDYLGIGAGAHSKVSSPGRIVREMRLRHPTQYLAGAREGAAVLERRELGAADAGFEFMLNALRLVRGFELSLFERATGFPLDLVRPRIDAAVCKGLLELEDLHARPTALGLRFLNDLQASFLD